MTLPITNISHITHVLTHRLRAPYFVPFSRHPVDALMATVYQRPNAIALEDAPKVRCDLGMGADIVSARRVSIESNNAKVSCGTSIPVHDQCLDSLYGLTPLALEELNVTSSNETDSKVGYRAVGT